MVADGDGFVYPGPFAPGDIVKYTEVGLGGKHRQKKIGSAEGEAGAVRWHLLGHGELTVTGFDPSGNQTTAMCFVPPPPK